MYLFILIIILSLYIHYNRFNKTLKKLDGTNINDLNIIIDDDL